MTEIIKRSFIVLEDLKLSYGTYIDKKCGMRLDRDKVFSEQSNL